MSVRSTTQEDKNITQQIQTKDYELELLQNVAFIIFYHLPITKNLADKLTHCMGEPLAKN